MAIQSTSREPAPQFTADKVLQVRTGKIKPCFGLSEPSAIFKTPHHKPVKVDQLGCEGDEHAFKNHGGPDKALMHYASKHYKQWQAEYPQNAHLFTPGGFGENIVAEEADEHNLCIGDILRLGKDMLIQVSEPRQPCYKLNHRFEIKDMSWQSQNTSRTGWYYRVLRGGYLQPGDEIVLIDRKYPKWTIAKVQQHLYEEPYRKDEAAMVELSQLPELGLEIRTIFENRLKKIFRDDNQRLQGGAGDSFRWSQYRLVERRKETPKIISFVFEAQPPIQDPKKAEPGSHIRVKLGEDGKIVRAYSVVKGDNSRFKLGISLDPSMTRGGARYLHEKVHTDDILAFSEMKSNFALSLTADEHIFIAGGVGITAFMISAELLQSQGRTYHLYYAVHSTSEIVFKDELQQFGDNITILNGEKGQRLDLLNVIGKARTHSHLYVCGPERLLEAVTTTVHSLGFPASNIHFEAFTAATSGDPFTVELAESKKILEVKEEQTLLEVLRDAGFDVPSSCEVGNCGTCRVGVGKGVVVHRGTGLVEGEKSGALLSCVSRGVGRIVLDL